MPGKLRTSWAHMHPLQKACAVVAVATGAIVVSAVATSFGKNSGETDSLVESGDCSRVTKETRGADFVVSNKDDSCAVILRRDGTADFAGGYCPWGGTMGILPAFNAPPGGRSMAVYSPASNTGGDPSKKCYVELAGP